MATTKIQAHDSYAKLQADVDNILAGVHHLFDDIAEYARDSDPANIIDLDKVLSNSHSSKISQCAPASINEVQQLKMQHANAHRNFPANPEKIVNAMPLELQEEVRIYESRVMEAEKPRQSFVKFFLKRLEF